MENREPSWDIYMKIKKEYANQLLDSEDAYDDETDDLVYTFVESSDWVQNHKYQYIDITFFDPKTNKHYQFSTSRSGSPFTDWNYDMDYEEYMDCYEVKEVEVTTTTWKRV